MFYRFLVPNIHIIVFFAFVSFHRKSQRKLPQVYSSMLKIPLPCDPIDQFAVFLATGGGGAEDRPYRNGRGSSTHWHPRHDFHIKSLITDHTSDMRYRITWFFSTLHQYEPPWLSQLQQTAVEISIHFQSLFVLISNVVARWLLFPCELMWT
jgi:hypothetical protein